MLCFVIFCYVLLCELGKRNQVLTPGGGTLRPIVAGTEIADGFVSATGFFGDICEARLWAEIEVNGKCGEGISGFVGEALPELRTGILGCGIVVLIHKGLVVWDIWDILGHLGPISGKKICHRDGICDFRLWFCADADGAASLPVAECES